MGEIEREMGRKREVETGRGKGRECTLRPQWSPQIIHSLSQSSVNSYLLCASSMGRSPGIFHDGPGNVPTLDVPIWPEREAITI